MRKKMNPLNFILLLMLSVSPALGQDSLKVFTMQDLFIQVLNYHPIARQAQLLSQSAKQEIRIARGAFDPSISTKYYSKSFKGNNYFDLWDNVLRVPVWFGTDLLLGYERNSGPNINPEDYTPTQGLTSLGISIPIGQGLIIDERRATLRTAQIFQNIAEAERVKIINKLLLQASSDYWNWAFHYQKMNLNRRGLDLARFRVEAVVQRIHQGDLAGIDSVEAMIQMQNFEVLVQQSEMEYKNASLILSNFLWKEGNVPAEISENVVPAFIESELEELAPEEIEKMIGQATSNHPDIIKLDLKLDQLEFERKYYADKLKPKLNLDYSLLQSNFPLDAQITKSDYVMNNYKIGISFYQPLFLRAERGRLQLNKLKSQESKFNLQMINREVVTNIHTYYNEWVGLQGQIRAQEAAVRNYQLLREGEQRRFENGESSLFLVNQRDQSLISNQIKLVELKTKYAKNKIYLQWASGRVEVSEN